jgi:DNA-binding transcriptional ArsR family regulator
MEKSAFRRVFGDSPLIRVLDFLLEEGRTFDYSLTDIAKNSGVAWSTLHEIFPRFEKLGIVKETRRIAQAKLYKLNEENPIVKELTKLDKNISECFIQLELAKQETEITDKKPLSKSAATALHA